MSTPRYEYMQMKRRSTKLSDERNRSAPKTKLLAKAQGQLWKTFQSQLIPRQRESKQAVGLSQVGHFFACLTPSVLFCFLSFLAMKSLQNQSFSGWLETKKNFSKAPGPFCLRALGHDRPKGEKNSVTVEGFMKKPFSDLS